MSGPVSRRILALALLSVAPVAASSAQAPAPRVVVAEATRVAFPLVVEAPGTALANESIEVRPKVSESITAIHFTEGQPVEADQVLVELRNTEAVAAVAAAKAALVDSESALRRARELLKTRALAASEFEQRMARRDADRAALDAAEARLADSVVRAPFAGRVGLRRVSLGSLVTPATMITTLDDTDPIKLDFDVPETALSRVAEGLPVVARSAAWRDVEFHGHVASVNTRVDPLSRTVAVRALVPNPDAQLRPGMFLSVKLLREDVDALVIPEQAVLPEESRQYVLVIGSDLKVEHREVQTGRRRPGQVEIVSGLAEGERVVAEGTQKARPGDTVEVVGELDVAEMPAR